MVKVIKSRFTGTGKEGDFKWMIGRPEHARTLFIFNDNEGEFYAHFNGGPHTCGNGGGNAAIRSHQCGDSPRAAGVPTGTYTPGPHYKGYKSLDAQVLKAIGDAITQIDGLLATGRFDAIAFSWNDETKLGGQIFKTAQPVRDHIVTQILEVAARH
jgi:hypothetical protein